MVFINKTLLSSDKVHLNAPLFVIWCQCITCVVICLVIKNLANFFPQYFYFPNGSPFSFKTAKKVSAYYILFTLIKS